MTTAIAVDPVVVHQAASLVRRARAGEENAAATLYRIGEEARRGNNPRASGAFAAVRSFIEQNPAQPFALGAEPAVILDSPKNGKNSDSSAIALPPPKPTAADFERGKPQLPRGIFDRIFDPEWVALVIVKACRYRYGLQAAAVVLASGPLLTNPVVKQFGENNFGSEESKATFFHGVRFPEIDAWQEVAPHLELPLRRCLAIGQCVGRARKIQAVRMPRSSISAYSDSIGWELGE